MTTADAKGGAITALIDAHRLFQLLPAAQRRRLADAAERYAPGAGERIIEADEFNHYLYFVTAGHVRVVANGEVVARPGEGDLIGEISASGLGTPVADVVADEGAQLLAFPVELVNEIAYDHPDFAEGLRAIAMGRELG